MQNETFRLIVRRGPQPNQVYELTAEVTNLGRDITNDIVINDREVSRHHLRFTRGADGCTMEDLGSTNGTFVNGTRLQGETTLKPGTKSSSARSVFATKARNSWANCYSRCSSAQSPAW